MSLRVSLGFARVPDPELDTFTLGIINAMTGNIAFPTPPVTMANLQTARTDFTTRIAAAKSGGPQDTAAKNNSRQSLLDLLRQLANYAQINCKDDLALLLRPGF